MKTGELTGAALDWAVARIEGFPADTARFIDIFIYQNRTGQGYCYSRDWSLAGPIIEREGVELEFDGNLWNAGMFHDEDFIAQDSTPLTAAMRCYVASKLGDEVTIPDELMEAA